MPKQIEMSDVRRGLIFSVLDNTPSLLPIMHYMTNWKHCDRMLLWLKENKITGKNLESWIKIQWGGTKLQAMSKFLEMKALKNVEIRPTILGDNWMV